MLLAALAASTCGTSQTMRQGSMQPAQENAQHKMVGLPLAVEALELLPGVWNWEGQTDAPPTQVSLHSPTPLNMARQQPTSKHALGQNTLHTSTTKYKSQAVTSAAETITLPLGTRPLLSSKCSSAQLSSPDREPAWRGYCASHFGKQQATCCRHPDAMNSAMLTPGCLMYQHNLALA